MQNVLCWIENLKTTFSIQKKSFKIDSPNGKRANLYTLVFFPFPSFINFIFYFFLNKAWHCLNHFSLFQFPSSLFFRIWMKDQPIGQSSSPSCKRKWPGCPNLKRNWAIHQPAWTQKNSPRKLTYVQVTCFTLLDFCKVLFHLIF